MTGRPIRGTAAVAAVLSACGPGAHAPRGVTTVDSAGVEVVTSSAPLWGPGEGWRVGEALLVMGGGDLDLFDVAGAVRRSDGHVVVADGGTSRLLFFDAQGRHQRTVGGEGDGPGEYRIIQALGSGGADTVWAYDFSHRRISVYEADGALSRTVTVDIPLGAVALAGWSDGVFVATQLWGDGDGGPLTTGLNRDPVAFVSIDRYGWLLDTLGLFPGREVLLRPEGQRMTMGAAPFARGVSYDVADGRLVVGDQVDYELRIYGLEGELLAIRRWMGDDLTITEADVDAWKEDQVASAAPADRPSVRAYLADAPVPHRRPAYGPVLVDAVGDVWVGRYAHPSQLPARWDVLDGRGAWLGAVEMPSGFRPLQVGEGWILGVARDEMDVERVELRLLDRSP